MSEVSTTQNFQDRLKNRIQESIGDLMTDEDLKLLVEKGINDTFFKERPRPGWQNLSYHEQQRTPNTMPPLMNEIVEKAVKEQVEKIVQGYVEKYMVENTDTINAMVKDVIEQGAGAAMLAAINRSFNQPLVQLGMSVEMALSNLRSKGLIV